MATVSCNVLVFDGVHLLELTAVHARRTRTIWDLTRLPQIFTAAQSADGAVAIC